MYGTLTLTGRNTTPSGRAHTGQAIVTANTVIRDTAGNVVMSGSEAVTLDKTGAWSLVLPCDSPELNPSTGIGYRVGYELRAATMPSQSFYATADMAGSTLDVSDIVSVSLPTPLSAIVGPAGADGAPGATGPQGLTGPQGVTGPKGDPGDSKFAFDTDGTPYYGATATPSTRVVTEASGTAAYSTAGHFHSKVKTDGTDQTATLQGELNSCQTFGVGVLELPGGTITCAGTITLTNDGATIGKQAPITLLGQGAHWSGRGTAPVGGTTLDIKGVDTYGKVKTNGLGLLRLTGLTFMDSAGTATPFIYTTNTTLHIDQCAFVGSKTGVSCNQDAVVLGGPNQVEGGSGWTDGFQGYGTVVSRNYFSGIRTTVKGQAFANACAVRDNTIWNTCGNPAGAAIEWDGKPTTGTQTAAGNVITGNLIEATNYQYAVRLKNASGCTVSANNIYDATATTSAIYFLDATTSTNTLSEGYSSPGKTVLVDNGSNNWFTPTSQGVYSKQPPPDFPDINYPAKAYGLRAYGPGGLLFQPLATMPDTGVVFQAKRGPSEATDPGGIVWQVQQNGTLVIGASATSGGNITGPFCRFTAGGRTWSGVGTATGQTNGANMSQDSGPGGSYFDAKNYAFRFFDHNGGPLRMRVGAGKDGFDLGAANDVTVQRDAQAALAVNAPIKTKATTTALRPTASSVGAGAQMYDTTLSKPIWSDGTTWRDAMGTAV